MRAGGDRKIDNILPVVEQAVGRGVQEFGFPPRVEACQVPHDVPDSLRDWSRDSKLPLGPGGHVRVDVLGSPARGVPAEVNEELGLAFVGLEIADVEDPETCCLSVNSDRHLLVDLWKS